MRMTINEDSKVVGIWLTKAEKDDVGLRESLQPLYKLYREQKYLVAVYMSGEQDLYENTRDLLLYNRRRAAEKEVQAAKAAGMSVQM